MDAAVDPPTPRGAGETPEIEARDDQLRAAVGLDQRGHRVAHRRGRIALDQDDLWARAEMLGAALGGAVAGLVIDLLEQPVAAFDDGLPARHEDLAEIDETFFGVELG